MAKLTRLGFGYELWANTAKDAIKKLDDILTIMKEVKTPQKKYFDPTWDRSKSLPLATSNGTFGTMTIVQSDTYPVAALAIKDLFDSPHRLSQIQELLLRVTSCFNCLVRSARNPRP
jgi:hypothetical protein